MSKTEKFIEEHTRNCSNECLTDSKPDGLGGYISRRNFSPWLTPDQALRAVEIAREEMIEKAIKWVEYNNENGGCKFDGWVENIKQAMKDDTTKR